MPTPIYNITSSGYRQKTTVSPGITHTVIDMYVDRSSGRKAALLLLDLTDQQLLKTFQTEKCLSWMIPSDRDFWVDRINYDNIDNPTAQKLRDALTRFFALLGYGPFNTFGKHHESRSDWINRQLKKK